MHSDVTRSAGDAPYRDDPMSVEESATPDGRRLLYFTFGHPEAAPLVSGAHTTSSQHQDERRPQEQG